MIKIKRFINQLMSSNCFVVYDDETGRATVIDPGSEKSKQEISFIEENQLILDYIILTHEHTDHTWGVNALKDKFPNSKLVCSELCEKYAKKASRAYFLFYYDDPNYRYELKPADIIINKDDEKLKWGYYEFAFVFSPGHSRGSMCIQIGDMLFTGDTIMPFPPHFNSRDSDVKDWESSIFHIESIFPKDIIIYPGHGESHTLDEWVNSSYKHVK